MPGNRRWDRCVEHRGSELNSFLADYFAAEDRTVVLIAAAGFDPRSTALCERLTPIARKLRALFIQERRPNPAAGHVAEADANIRHLSRLLPDGTLIPIDIFGSDNAVIGGRNVVTALHKQHLEGATDVVVDVSGMSVGTSFPMIRYLLGRMGESTGLRNLHLFVAPDAALDESIVPIAGDTVGFVHGFRGGWALDAKAGAAKLWLPQLARGRRAALQRIYDFVVPHDTCPILPFPSARPRLADELAEHYATELESAWEVDPRNVVYAAEDDPLDLYRTLLKIDDLRRPVFEEFGGSLLVLSPTGSKVLALGALMAALERDLPVVHLEAIGYEYSIAAQAFSARGAADLIHLWLEGDAYEGSRSRATKGSVLE